MPQPTHRFVISFGFRFFFLRFTSIFQLILPVLDVGTFPAFQLAAFVLILFFLLAGLLIKLLHFLVWGLLPFVTRH